MNLDLNSLALADPMKICLDTSPAIQNQICQQIQSEHTPTSRYQAYLNQICLSAILPWLQEEYKTQVRAWPSTAALPSYWEVVNGTAVTLGEIRLLLIPSGTADLSEMRVPQEWVDIPSWAADYYLAAQVEPDSGQVRIWGYCTHRHLKTKGSYDPSERTYCLDESDIIDDINALWVVRQLCPDEQTRSPLVPLPALSSAQAENLLLRLGNQSIVMPQLAVPFELWGALLDNGEWRRRLYERRLERGQQVNLGQWFQNICEAGWQTVEEILSTLSTSEPNLAYSSRNAEHNRENSPAIPALIELLQNHRDKSTRLRAADLLGHIANDNNDAIAALTDLLGTTKDDDIRRQAAVSLGKIDPGNFAAGVRRARLVDLGLLIDDCRVVLAVTLMPEAEQRTNISLRVFPTGQQTYLPPHLQLVVLDESGEIILEAQSRSNDNSIQLAFRGDSGDGFSIKVALGDVSVTEDFII